MVDAVQSFGSGLLGGAWPVVWSLIKIVLVVAPLMLCVATSKRSLTAFAKASKSRPPWPIA